MQKINGARYKGCTYFCDQCASITVNNFLGKVRNRILYRLNNLSNNNLGSEVRVYTECPSDRFPEDVKKPKIELFAFRLAFSDAEPTEEQRNTAILFGVEEELDKQRLCIQTIRSNLLGINPDCGSMTISCPKLPKDTDARIGVRRNPKNPDKKEKIFGYNLVLSTSVELHLKIELPVAVTNIAGNAEEGRQIIQNKEQIHKHHKAQVKIDIADVHTVKYWLNLRLLISTTHPFSTPSQRESQTFNGARNTILSITTIIYEGKDPSPLLIITGEMKTYPNTPSLIEVMTKMGGPLLPAASLPDLMDLIKSING